MVHFKPGSPAYAAFLFTQQVIGNGTSRLEIFDPQGKRVLLEQLPEVCASLAVIPAVNPHQRETLLVGGSKHIWRY